ncbi:MAG: NAD(P)-dependent alcohol dehydrogenase [Planctomycetota bacterium]
MFHAYAAEEAEGDFKSFEYDPGELQPRQVEIDVSSCGICHSDLSMRDNDWHMTQYPFVGGHEVVGKIAALGHQVPELEVGQTVGLGWYSKSCTHCMQCLSGASNRCVNSEQTIVGRHGGFGDKVRCDWTWATPIPDGLDADKAGPLFCGGITAFTPFLQHNIRPLDRVGVIGIGGLGHLAVMFADKWGCEVTAFSTTADKEQEARDMGADDFVVSRDEDQMKKQAGRFDLIINTTNVKLPWGQYVEALAPGGVLHSIGVAPDFGLENTFPLIAGQKSLSGSPLGTIADTRKMLDFCSRHGIEPITETYAMADINDAFEKLHTGSPRYRLVLKN